MAATIHTALSGQNQLPHWNRFKDAQEKFISAVCFPKNELQYVKYKKAAARTNNWPNVKTKNLSMQDVCDFFHSDWAKLDVMTYPLFHEL